MEWSEEQSHILCNKTKPRKLRVKIKATRGLGMKNNGSHSLTMHTNLIHVWNLCMDIIFFTRGINSKWDPVFLFFLPRTNSCYPGEHIITICPQKIPWCIWKCSCPSYFHTSHILKQESTFSWHMNIDICCILLSSHSISKQLHRKLVVLKVKWIIFTVKIYFVFI